MALCEKKIQGCIALDCEKPIFAGMESGAFVFNKADITGITYEQVQIGTDSHDDPIYKDNPNMITGINMASNAVGYRIEQFGKTPYTGSNTSMVEGNAMNKFTETFNFVVSDNSEKASRELLDNLANGTFVAVVRNQYHGSDNRSEFQVYGAKKGLKAATMDNDKYAEETDGGWAVSLVSENVPTSAVFMEHKTTNTVDTLEYLQGLAPACV